MHKVNIHEAKTHLSKLLEAAMRGEVIIIAKSGKPIARLGPIEEIKTERKFGVLKGKIKISSDFDAPLADDILDSFEGNT